MPLYPPTSSSWGGGWSVKSYTTGANSTSFSVTGLDLATDLRYKFIVEADALWATSAASFTYTINSVTTASSYIPTGGENNNDGTTTGTGTLDFEDNAMNFMSSQCNSMHMEMNASLLSYDGTNSRPVFQWDVGGLGQDATMKVFNVRGSGYQNTQTNITSIQFKSSVAKDWRVWVLKPLTA